MSSDNIDTLTRSQKNNMLSLAYEHYSREIVKSWLQDFSAYPRHFRYHNKDGSSKEIEIDGLYYKLNKNKEQINLNP